MLKVSDLLVPPCAQRFLAFLGIIENIYCPLKLIEISQSINKSKLYLLYHFIKNSLPVSRLHNKLLREKHT